VNPQWTRTVISRTCPHIALAFLNDHLGYTDHFSRIYHIPPYVRSSFRVFCASHSQTTCTFPSLRSHELFHRFLRRRLPRSQPLLLPLVVIPSPRVNLGTASVAIAADVLGITRRPHVVAPLSVAAPRASRRSRVSAHDQRWLGNEKHRFALSNCGLFAVTALVVSHGPHAAVSRGTLGAETAPGHWLDDMCFSTRLFCIRVGQSIYVVTYTTG
jgi:hypothetical protein